MENYPFTLNLDKLSLAQCRKQFIYHFIIKWVSELISCFPHTWTHSSHLNSSVWVERRGLIVSPFVKYNHVPSTVHVPWIIFLFWLHSSSWGMVLHHTTVWKLGLQRSCCLQTASAGKKLWIEYLTSLLLSPAVVLSTTAMKLGWTGAQGAPFVWLLFKTDMIVQVKNPNGKYIKVTRVYYYYLTQSIKVNYISMCRKMRCF